MVTDGTDETLPFALRALRADETLRSTTGPAALRRRRRLVAALESRDGTATLPELVDELTAASAALERDPARLRTRLVHVDLPRLDDAGAVAYDADRETVRLLERPDWYRPADG